MIEKKIIVCTGTDRDKNIRVRLSLLIVEDGMIISEQYHSVALTPGDDHNAIRAAIEAHIGDKANNVPGAPWPSIPDDEWLEAKKHCEIVFTPERITIASERKEAAKLTKGVSDAALTKAKKV